MATVTRPVAGYTPTNPITNATKYQNDSAATSPRVAISSIKVDGDINKAFDVLSDHDDALEDHESRISDLENNPNSEFTDNAFRVLGSSDATKKVALEVDGLTTATTRTLAVQDVSGTILVTGGSDVAIADGGTGASDAATAFGNLKQAATTSATGVVELATTAETQAGSDTGRAITPSGLKGALLFSKAFEGSGITITANTDNATAHGLGAVPKLVTISLRALSPELGYGTGDEIVYANKASDSNNGITVSADATNLYVAIGSAGVSVAIARRDNRNGATITNNNWNIILRAWA